MATISLTNQVEFWYCVDKSTPLPRCGLVSLFDMLERSAFDFYLAGLTLRGIKVEALLDSLKTSAVESFDIARPITTSTVEKSKEPLKILRHCFSNIEMPISAALCGDLISDLERKTWWNVQELIGRIDNIENVANKELQERLFFYVSPERAKRYPNPSAPPFGKAVSDAFPDASFDIEEAAACLALGRATACVMHIMRALEVPLRALATKFSVSMERANWQNVLSQIGKQIVEMERNPKWTAQSDWKEQREFYAQAISHFIVLKDAWRNYAMHGREKYTDEIAERIFDNAAAFMRTLSERLSE